jgi:hypothetical protein
MIMSIIDIKHGNNSTIRCNVNSQSVFFFEEAIAAEPDSAALW